MFNDDYLGKIKVDPDRLRLSAPESQRVSRVHTWIASVMHVCKAQLGLNGYYMHSERVQLRHLTYGLVACCVLGAGTPGM